jgi:hypothetical protein
VREALGAQANINLSIDTILQSICRQASGAIGSTRITNRQYLTDTLRVRRHVRILESTSEGYSLVTAAAL